MSLSIQVQPISTIPIWGVTSVIHILHKQSQRAFGSNGLGPEKVQRVTGDKFSKNIFSSTYSDFLPTFWTISRQKIRIPATTKKVLLKISHMYCFVFCLIWVQIEEKLVAFTSHLALASVLLKKSKNLEFVPLLPLLGAYKWQGKIE